MGKVREQTMRVTVVEPNPSIEFEAAFGPVRPQLSLSFELSAGGTRVTLLGNSRPVGAVQARRVRAPDGPHRRGELGSAPQPNEGRARNSPGFVVFMRAKRPSRGISIQRGSRSS